MKNVRKGMSDFYKGQVVNPHHKDTQDYREWQFGFDRAYFENLERQKNYEHQRSKAKAG